MKANRSFKAADHGISNVLGAILVFNLLIMAMVMMQLVFVPAWDEEREENHSEALLSELSTLKGRIDFQVATQSNDLVSMPLDLYPERTNRGLLLSFVGRVDLATSDALPGTDGFSISSSGPTELTRITDPRFLGIGEVWIEGSSHTLADVTRMASLRTRFSEGVAESITLAIFDKDSAAAGCISFSRTATGEAHVETRRATCSETEKIFVANVATEPTEKAWFDVLNPDYRFDRLLASANGPYSVTATQTGADVAATYFQLRPGMTAEQLIGGGAQSLPSYTDSTASLRLQALSQYHRLGQRDYIYEHGGIIQSQSDGATMATAPAFDVSVAFEDGSPDRVVLDWTLPNLVPESLGSYLGVRPTLVAYAADHQSTFASMRDATVTVTTDFPQAWTTFWRHQFEEIGLRDGADFTLLQDDNEASFTVLGAPGTAGLDVTLHLRQANVRLTQ